MLYREGASFFFQSFIACLCHIYGGKFFHCDASQLYNISGFPVIIISLLFGPEMNKPVTMKSGDRVGQSMYEECILLQ